MRQQQPPALTYTMRTVRRFSKWQLMIKWRRHAHHCACATAKMADLRNRRVNRNEPQVANGSSDGVAEEHSEKGRGYVQLPTLHNSTRCPPNHGPGPSVRTAWNACAVRLEDVWYNERFITAPLTVSCLLLIRRSFKKPGRPRQYRIYRKDPSDCPLVYACSFHASNHRG